MTLGRTSTGAIKLKTDEEGGGLRAVNCACCGCDCGIQIPQDLRDLVSTGNVTMYGLSPDYFDDYGDSWRAEWILGNYGQGYDGLNFADIIYDRETGCLTKGYYNLEWFQDDGGEGLLGFADFGTPDDTCNSFADDPTISFVQKTFTINGEGAYDYYQIFDYSSPNYGVIAVPPPNLVFS